MKTIILNSGNVVDNGYNDTYTYKFPIGAVNFTDCQIALSSLSMYYSWFNITDSVDGGKYNNNLFTYTWPYGTNGASNPTTVSVLITSGYYTVASLNSYLQSIMFKNGHYLIDSNGDYVYYLAIVENSTYYAIEFDFFLFPNTLPSGYTQGQANGTGGYTFAFPGSSSASKTPSITIPSDNNFTNLVGIPSGTYPTSNTTSGSVISSFTPQLSPVSALVMTCSLLNNRYANPSTLFYSFSPANVSFGSLISINPPYESFIDIQNGQYTEISIRFFDQSLNRIAINDSNLVILLNIKQKTD